MANREAEYPISPSIAMLRLPYLSLALPHAALVSAQAIAEKANTSEACISDKPRSLARGGTITKTKDCPNPTVNRPNLSHVEADDFIKIFY
jgi:hypothetical protein